MPFICQYCHQSFARKYCLTRHINEQRCKCIKKSTDPPMVVNQIEALEKRLERLKEDTSKEIDDLRKKPNTVNQVLQVICLTNQDNYLDMLTDRMGNFDQAIEYIKDCALSNVSGDCKLIEKIYLSDDANNIQYQDKMRSKVAYYNERCEKVIDNKDLFGKKIANNLQNSYLKGINYLINQNLNQKISPNRFLEDYDLQAWNSHIYSLSDQCYQRKIVSQLKIPSP